MKQHKDTYISSLQAVSVLMMVMFLRLGLSNMAVHFKLFKIVCFHPHQTDSHWIHLSAHTLWCCETLIAWTDYILFVIELRLIWKEMQCSSRSSVVIETVFVRQQIPTLKRLRELVNSWIPINYLKSFK